MLHADLDAIKAAGLPTTTVVVITNTDEFKDVMPVEPGNVSFKDHVMEVFHHEKEGMHKRLLQLTHHWHKARLREIRGTG
ncbi:hypothetical protein ABNZ43_04485 [Weissella sp. GP1]|uniref:hypothetical protein n=1 Tax=Weissella confusa TaxID=1583 RepID=UPI0032DAD269